MCSNSRKILASAEKYWIAARALDYINTLSRSDVQPYNLPETFDETDVVQPKMVLELFSIELFLKALHAHRNGGFEHMHDLSKLFTELPHVDKKSIDDLWEKIVGRYSDGLSGPPPERDLLTPAEVLYEVRDFFQRWRYSFDSKVREPTYDRKEVVPEIFDVPEVIRSHVREVVGGHLST